MLRRIDELGRIVIPKEIRKKLKIREGDNLDIFVDNDGVILRKYSPLNDLDKMVEIMTLGFKKYLGIDIIVTDKEKVISSTISDIKNLENISKSLTEIIENKKELEVGKASKMYLTDTYQIKENIYIKPICIYGDLFGAVIVLYDYNLQSNMLDYLNTIHYFCVEYIQT